MRVLGGGQFLMSEVPLQFFWLSAVLITTLASRSSNVGGTMAQGRSTKIISMMKWTRASRLAIKNSFSGWHWYLHDVRPARLLRLLVHYPRHSSCAPRQTSNIDISNTPAKYQFLESSGGIAHHATLQELMFGEVSRGEKIFYSGPDPESYIIEYTLVYEDHMNAG